MLVLLNKINVPSSAISMRSNRLVLFILASKHRIQILQQSTSYASVTLRLVAP